MNVSTGTLCDPLLAQSSSLAGSWVDGLVGLLVLAVNCDSCKGTGEHQATKLFSHINLEAVATNDVSKSSFKIHCLLRTSVCTTADLSPCGIAYMLCHLFLNLFQC